MKVFNVACLTLLLALGYRVPVHAESGSMPDSATADTAEDSGAYTRLGFFVAVAGGAALGDLGKDAAGLPSRGSFIYGMDTASGSVGMRAGYRFHPRLSAELLFDYQTGWEFHVPGLAFEGDHATLEAWNVVANLKLHLTETRWQPYIVAGIGAGGRVLDTRVLRFDPEGNERRDLEHHDEAFVARVGGGLDIYLTDAVTFGSEIVGVIGTGELSGLDYATTSVVLAYHFE